jgi:hypothetical protein
MKRTAEYWAEVVGRWSVASAILVGVLVSASLVGAKGKQSAEASNDEERGGRRVAEPFRWSKPLASGQTIEIKGVNGGITAEYTSGADVVVEAERRGRRSDPEKVRIVVELHQGGATICALYPTPAGKQPNTCEPGDGGRMSTRNNDVVVDFRVRVPAGVRLAAKTVNGGIEAVGLKGSIEAETVNGSVRLATSAAARASTVNGSINADVGAIDEAMELETVNGRITVALPEKVRADLNAHTVNGSIDSEFEVAVQGKISHRRLRGTIGGGGADLLLSTVNGSIALVRGSKL